jgi:polycystin 2
MSLYNPNIHMFTAVTLLAEFLSTGSVIPSARFEPMDLQSNERITRVVMPISPCLDFTSLFHVLISIIYLMFIVYFMIEQIRLIIRTRLAYLQCVWSYIEWGMIACAWSALAVYIWRAYELNRIGDLFKKTNGDVYINLQLATYVNDVLTFLLGFSCFFGTVKLLRFARYARRLSLFGETLSHASTDLWSFGWSFAVLFMAFLVLFYLLFMSTLWTCANLLHTAQMLFEMILMKFDTSELISADAVLGPICFTLFIFFVVFVGMTMFISIINDGFHRARHKLANDRHIDYDMFAHLWRRFQLWTGSLLTSCCLTTGVMSCLGMVRVEIWEQRDREMRPNYFDPIERFPDKMDQFLGALNKVS